MTRDAAQRRAVGRVVGRLDSEELPSAMDFPVRVFVLPDGYVNGWARRVSGWALWVVFTSGTALDTRYKTSRAMRVCRRCRKVHNAAAVARGKVAVPIATAAEEDEGDEPAPHGIPRYRRAA